jgi:hypothetical protein
VEPLPFVTLEGRLMTTPSDDIRTRIARALRMLRAHEQGSGQIRDPRGLWLDVTLSIHELEAVLALLRRHLLP